MSQTLSDVSLSINWLSINSIHAEIAGVSATFQNKTGGAVILNAQPIDAVPSASDRSGITLLPGQTVTLNSAFVYARCFGGPGYLGCSLLGTAPPPAF